MNHPARYRDPALPIADRVADLLPRMTLEEKAAQLISVWFGKQRLIGDDGIGFSAERARAAWPHGFGQLTRASDWRGVAQPPPGQRGRSSEQTIAFVDEMQRWAIGDTRLGIPVLVHEEALHGYMGRGATMFPSPIALAGSFDPALVREVHRIAAREMRAHGGHLALAPVVDIARDPRWGRIEETCGEDPYLCGEMGVAAVLGLQGDDSRRGRPIGTDRVLATLKHLTGHGQPQAGNNAGPAPLPERELREHFLAPFREVVTRAAPAAVMPSYNEVDGQPSHAHRWLIETVLRGEWGFDGAVVSDYHGLQQLQTLHRVVADTDQAAIAALAAGVDCETPDDAVYGRLAALVRTGRVSESAIDTACARMLALKFRAGLFEHPFGDLALARRITADAEARALARRAAQRSICLLKNDGGLLPLRPGAHRRIAVIGPNAAVARLGGYSSEPPHPVSLLEGVRARLACDAAGGGVEVVHAQGVFITRSEDRTADDVQLADPARNRGLIAEALALARRSDLIVLAIGDTEQTSREGYASNHLGDRSSLDLVGEQNALFDALAALTPPVPMVVVAINGRPPSYPRVVRRARALLECWYPGQEGGHAIADVLFGDVAPGAKLPLTVARDVSQLPLYFNARPAPQPGAAASRARRPPPPLFPFGHGLGYTRFELRSPRLASSAPVDGGAAVEVELVNIGHRPGDEVVQLYVRARLTSNVRPRLQLAAFERLTLPPGRALTVRFALDAAALSRLAGDGGAAAGAGTGDGSALLELLVGTDSRRLQRAGRITVPTAPRGAAGGT